MSIESVQNVFREVFVQNDLVIFPEMTARDVKDWDSFNHINLIMGLEDTFGVEFSTDEIASFSCVGDILSILKKKGVAINEQQ